MPRATLPKTTPLGGEPTRPLTADSADMVMTAADVANLNQFVAAGKDVVVAFNSGGSAYTVTITSAPLNGRTGDITTYSIGAGEFAVFGPFATLGWKQTDGYVYLQASNAAVKFGVLDLSNF
jgi:hypothetical protein